MHLRRTVSILLAAFMLIDAILTAYAVLNAPFPSAVPLGSPMAYLNLYVHVPIAWVTYTLFTLALIFAILYLKTRNPKFDKLVVYSVYLGLIYAAITLITGSLWAAESWGSAWNWDPRETGVLLLFVAYLAYVALRSSIKDEEKKPVITAVYAIAAYSMVPISFAAPIIAGYSLHPSFVQASKFMESPMVRGIFFSKVFTTMITALLFLAALYYGIENFVKYTAIIVLGIVIITAFLMYKPYTGRVVMAKLEGNQVLLTLKVGEKVENVTVVKSAVPEDLIEGNQVFLRGHLVLIEKNKVVLVRPMCVILDYIIYGLTVFFLPFIVERLREYV